MQERTDTTPEIMTPEQVAQYVQVHVKTVYNWIRDGKLKASKLGPRSWRIQKEDVLYFLDTQATGTESKGKEEDEDNVEISNELLQVVGKAIQDGQVTATRPIKMGRRRVATPSRDGEVQVGCTYDSSGRD